MFNHRHPYSPFIPPYATKLIVGTIPPPRFSVGKLFKEDVDFCYGSKFGLLWPILDEIFGLNLSYKNDSISIDQRKSFLNKFNIGICDMVESCEREKINASDLGMLNIELRDQISYLKTHKAIDTILFMGGNSKNGPEYLFRKQLRLHGIKALTVTKTSPKKQVFTIDDRTIHTYSLISPSNAANRSIGTKPFYKKMKAINPSFSTLDYRILQYRDYFI